MLTTLNWYEVAPIATDIEYNTTLMKTYGGVYQWLLTNGYIGKLYDNSTSHPVWRVALLDKGMSLARYLLPSLQKELSKMRRHPFNEVVNVETFYVLVKDVTYNSDTYQIISTYIKSIDDRQYTVTNDLNQAQRFKYPKHCREYIQQYDLEKQQVSFLRNGVRSNFD